MTKHTKLAAVASPFIIEGDFRIYSQVMSVEDWAKVPRNPIQRNELLRKAPHLARFMPEHCITAMIVDTQGNTLKLDGHTRDHRISKGKIRPQSGQLLVNTFECMNPSLNLSDEACRLYRSYDSRQANKKSSDDLQSAISYFNLNLVSFLSAGTFGIALAEASKFPKLAPRNTTDKIALLGYWQKEVVLLDSINPIANNFKAPMIAAALLMLRSDSSQAMLDVLDTYNQRTGGVTQSGKRNTFQYLDDYRRMGVGPRAGRNGQSGEFTTNGSAMTDATQRFVSLFSACRRDSQKLLERMPKMLDLEKFKLQLK